jgi:multiple sugar transport system permease protein
VNDSVVVRRRRIWPPKQVFGFLMPNFAGFLLFTLVPVILSLGMAFTNWTLKPSVPREFVGLRNFADALGFSALGAASPWILFFFCGSALLLLAGLVGAAWMALSKVRCGRLGASLILLAGALVGGGTLVLGLHHSLVIAAIIFLLLGWALWDKEPDARFPPQPASLIPGIAVVAGIAGMALLNDAMWAAYQPNDPRFWYYLYNTVYLMLGLPFSVAGSLFLAILLSDSLPVNRSRGWAAAGLCLITGGLLAMLLWGAGYRDASLLAAVFWAIAALGLAFNVVSFRTFFYLPAFTSGVALMILWKALYNPQTGPINALLAALTGMETSSLPQWLASIELAKPSLMIMGFWTAIGGTNMLLYLAALSNVPVDLTEAAEIDGASRWQRFVHVTWPQLAPTTFFISIVSVIGGLQGGFEQARVMTGGGPAGATTTLSYYIYTVGFHDLNFGYAAAISWVLFAMLFCITAFNWRFGRSLDV